MDNWEFLTTSNTKQGSTILYPTWFLAIIAIFSQYFLVVLAVIFCLWNLLAWGWGVDELQNKAIAQPACLQLGLNWAWQKKILSLFTPPFLLLFMEDARIKLEAPKRNILLMMMTQILAPLVMLKQHFHHQAMNKNLNYQPFLHYQVKIITPVYEVHYNNKKICVNFY